MSSAIFHSLDAARGRFGPCALAIGNFDGVHIGHQKLVAETVRVAAARGLTPAVLTFDPHPTAVVAPHRVPPLITPLNERLRLLVETGAQRIFVLNFTPDIARLTAEDFVRQILLEALDTKAVLVGENFRFGYRQAGTPEVLRALAHGYGFTAEFLRPVTYRGQIVSSTAVRTELSNGQVVRAGRLLGRAYALRGHVVSGRGIGSKQTVPTLNLRPSPELIVPEGIYVTETCELPANAELAMSEAGNRRWPSVTSCGHNPTFGATDLTVETYLLDALEGNSPQVIEVRFLHFLRPEETYPDAASLKAQIMKDVARAKAYWRHAKTLPKTASSIY